MNENYSHRLLYLNIYLVPSWWNVWGIRKYGLVRKDVLLGVEFEVLKDRQSLLSPSP